MPDSELIPGSSLAHLGWDQGFQDSFSSFASGLRPGRVARVDRGMVTVLLPEPTRVSSNRFGVATGDWAAIGPGANPDDPPVVAGLLPRRTSLVRRHSGNADLEQVMAANVDTVLVVSALDSELSPRRLERYLSLVWQSGALPVLVLTKSDLVTPGALDRAISGLRQVAQGAAIRAISCTTGQGVAELAAEQLRLARTVALIGLSGAGKSTLVNQLSGRASMAVGETRSDGKGRHTTSHRELVICPGGGLLLDTPGMRGVGLWGSEDGMSQAFSELEALAQACRFSDCAHQGEPGCAVAAALADGSLDPERLEGWRKLQRELRSLAARQGDRQAREEERHRWRELTKEQRSRPPRR